VEHGSWLKDLVVFLAAAGLVVPLFHRARISAVLGFLLVGVAVGPYGFGRLVDDFPFVRYLTIEDRSRVEPFGELGVIFLLFLLGLELSVARLWELRRPVFGMGGAQFVLSAAAIAGIAGIAGAGTPTAVVLGLCLAMSSTAVVMQLLEESGRSALPEGRIALSVLLLQDLMVPLVLLGTGLLGRGVGGLASLGAALLQALAAVVGIGLIGYFVARPIFHFGARTGGREFILAVTLLIVIGLSAATAQAGLSTALGAFLAGLLLAETQYRHELEADLSPIKGLLLGVFFISVGMTVDLAAALQNIVPILLAVLLLMAVKALILFLVCRLFGVAAASALEIGVLLAQASEFAFVVIALARSNGTVAPQIAELATVTVGISMMLTPLAAAFGRRIAERLRERAARGQMPETPGEYREHVIIGGFGRVGQTIAATLKAENVAFVALDTDAELVAEHRKAGEPVYYGDAGRIRILERAGGEHARAFVVTVDAPRAAERMVVAARQIRPDAPTLARAREPAHAARLLAAGAVDVIPEATEASLQLAARLLEALGLPDEAVRQRTEKLRDQALAQLRRDSGTSR
jgi:CPA2 family monovalent cation:H+ antiporter-2